MLLKSSETGYGVYHGYLECKINRISAIACLGKKVSFSYGNLRLFPIFNFQIQYFSLGQGVVQIAPNWVWSIRWVPRV